MKAFFLGGFAATVAPRILAKVETALKTEILADDSAAALTPHCSSSSDATAGRRWSLVAGNIDRFARGEPLENFVLQT